MKKPRKNDRRILALKRILKLSEIYFNNPKLSAIAQIAQEGLKTF